MNPTSPSPAELIDQAHRGTLELASEAGISPTTLIKYRDLNQWPKQRRPRLALARVLGLTGDPMAPGAGDAAASAHGAESTQPSVA